jgi:hypothetical protein
MARAAQRPSSAPLPFAPTRARRLMAGRFQRIRNGRLVDSGRPVRAKSCHSPTLGERGAEIKNFAHDADMPTGGGSAASQSECSICCSAMAVVQGCCLFSQTELRGISKSGSANIPTATAISSGRCSGSQNTVPPHSGQKLNVTVLPLSARRTYRLTMPLASRTCSRG